MKVLIIGCGKFGVRVSEYLSKKNHQVVVVDKDPEAFHALSEEFTGETICGVGYDRDVLRQAGIASADVLIGCTSSDSLNAVVANVAKNVFHVPTVIARMYDPIRARMFESMGIYTVSITRLGLNNVIEYLEGNKNWQQLYKIGSDLVLVRARIPASLVGTPIADIEREGKLSVCAIERRGASVIPDKDAVCEFNDALYLCVRADYAAQARDELRL